MPPGSVNEYTSCGWEGKGRYGSFRLRMNVWVCRKNCEIYFHVPHLSASAVVIHYEEALYQVYAPLPLPFTRFNTRWQMVTPLLNCTYTMACSGFANPVKSREHCGYRIGNVSLAKQTECLTYFRQIIIIFCLKP